MPRLHAKLLALLWGCLVACDGERHETPSADTGSSRERRGPLASAPPAAEPSVVTESDKPDAADSGAASACEQAIARALLEPPTPGTPKLDAARIALLVNVKAQPAVFVRAPQYAASADVVVKAFRRWWLASPHPAGVLQRIIDTVPRSAELLRAVALREGYLYAEDLAHAEALIRLLRAESLFTEPEVWIQRGEELLTARRAENEYRYTNGQLEGQPVALVLFDRVGVGPVPPPVHVDLRGLRYRLGFERLHVLHQSERSFVAELVYGPHRVLSLLSHQAAHLELACEIPSASELAALQAWRSQRRVFNTAVQSVQAAIALQIQDGLPFDEPLHELGQEDGKLRGAWLRAYDRGWDAYRHRDDVYRVFGRSGQPWVPEVCVDFLLDTLERASGTWWAPKGQPRKRHVGKLDFNAFDRENLRRVPQFLQFALDHADWFDVLSISKAEQVPIGSLRFVDYLARNYADFVPGDLVLIGGHVPWDPRPYVHYHSLFVYDSDPVSGMPILIAANPGRPRQVTWIWEARRTPRRTLRYRVRPKAAWLASVVERVGSDLPSLALTSPWAFGQ